MKVSEITLDVLKEYCGVCGDEDNIVLSSCLSSARKQAESYTGLTVDELDEYEDITIAVLTIANDNYIFRFNQSGSGLNKSAEFILSMHSRNLI